MSKDGVIRVNNLSARTLRGERMSALVRSVSNSISAEIIDALVSGKPKSAPKAQIQVAQKRDREARTVGEIVLKHFGEHSLKERRRIAGALMSRDIMTGEKMSAADRAEMRMTIESVRKVHPLEDKEFLARVGRILMPAKPPKKADIVGWNLHWTGILEGVLNGPGNSAGSGSAPQQHTQLQFRLHKVICNDDTNELGKDEIATGAVSTHGTLDESDNVTSAAEPEVFTPYDLGKYKTGDQRTLGPLNVETFNLSGLSFPRLFIVNLALAEVDQGGFAGFLQDLYDAVDEYLLVIISAAGLAIGAAIAGGLIAGGAAGTIAGPLGTLIGAAIGVTISAIVAAIATAANDEIFEVQQCVIEVPSRSALFNGSNETPVESLSYMGFGGEYTLRYNWRLT